MRWDWQIFSCQAPNLKGEGEAYFSPSVLPHHSPKNWYFYSFNLFPLNFIILKIIVCINILLHFPIPPSNPTLIKIIYLPNTPSQNNTPSDPTPLPSLPSPPSSSPPNSICFSSLFCSTSALTSPLSSLSHANYLSSYLFPSFKPLSPHSRSPLYLFSPPLSLYSSLIWFPPSLGFALPHFFSTEVMNMSLCAFSPYWIYPWFPSPNSTTPAALWIHY